MTFPSITWSARTGPTPSGATAADIVWVNVVRVEVLTYYYAVGYVFSTGEGIIARSVDGITWTGYQTADIKAQYWSDITYHAGSGRLIAVGGFGTSHSGRLLISTDSGATWAPGDIDTGTYGGSDAAAWGSVIALPSGRVVAAAIETFDDTMPSFAYSDDAGDNWTGVTAPAPYNSGGSYTLGTLWGRMAARDDGSRIIAPNNDDGAVVAYSDDEGATWSPSSAMPAASGAAYGSGAAWSEDLGLFLITGTEQFRRSSIWSGDGSAWTNRFRATTFDQPSFLSGSRAWIPDSTPFFLVAGNPTSPPGDTVYAKSSTDAITWTDDSTTPPTTAVASWMGIAFSLSRRRIVMVSGGGDIVTGDIADPAEVRYVPNGIISYRLMVEGWPEEFVTDSWITHATNKDGRSVYSGLCRDGMRIADRVIMHEGRVQADGNAFRVRPIDSYERPLQSFSNYPEPIAQLGASIDELQLSLALIGGGALTNGSIYHLGSEAVRAGAANAITRHIWDTSTQSHHTSVHDEARAVYVYARPPTMEGRRAYLYAYGEGDDPAGDGALIWRGIVSRPPRLDRDGLTWMVEVGSIVDTLRQQVAGGIEEAHPIGIYHHTQCAVGLHIVANNAASGIYYYTGIDDDEAGFIANVNDLLETVRSAMSITQIDPGGLTLQHRHGEPWTINVTPNADMTDLFELVLGSPIIGLVVASDAIHTWVDQDTGAKPDFLVGGLLSGRHYFAELSRSRTHSFFGDFDTTNDTAAGFSYDGPPVSPLGAANILAFPLIAGPHRGEHFFVDVSVHSTLPYNRIYVDRDLSAAAAVYISDTLAPTPFYKITATGVDGDGRNYIEVALYTGNTPPKNRTPEEHQKDILTQRGFDGFLTSQTNINVVRDYVGAGALPDFIAALKSAAIDANDGDTPHITSADLTAWAFGDTVASPLQTQRSYRFAKAHDLETILAEECKLAAHFPRIEFDGRIGLLPLPIYSDAAIVADDHVLDSGVIVTPGDGYGAWPGWEPQRDGLVTMVQLRDVYDPAKDEWRDKPEPFQDPDAIATHKGRGKQVMSVAPYSSPANFSAPPEFEVFEDIARAYLGMFAEDYAVPEFEVPFERLPVLCGDTVRVTNTVVPAGDGTRGMTDRAGIVIEREWTMDPAAGGAPGRLRVLVPLRPVVGYTPSAFVTGHTDNGGNNWTLHCDLGDELNREWSTNADGLALEHFRAGYFIEIVEFDSAAPTRKVGTVVSDPDAAAGTITVQLATSWTPGTKLWTLEFRDDPDGAHSITAQRQFAYVAEDDLTLASGAPFRRFA